MIANRMKPVLLAALTAALFSALGTAADARERWRHGEHHRHFSAHEFAASSVTYRHRSHFVENRRWDRQGDGRRNRPAEIDRADGFADRSFSQVRHLGGYYGGAIDAYSVRGNGSYFLDDGYHWPQDGRRREASAPRAKIIDVQDSVRGNNFAGRNGCSYEGGVCVIRGDR